MKILFIIGASGIHVGAMSFGKMEGDASVKNIASMLQEGEADGPYFHQTRAGMKQTTPVISGGMSALCLPAFFESLGHSKLILTAGGKTVKVRAICRKELKVFKSLEECLFYIAAVVVFSTHMCLAWQKAFPAPSPDMPTRYHSKVVRLVAGLWPMM